MNITSKKNLTNLFLFLLGALMVLAASPAVADITLDTQENGITISEVEKGHEFLVRVFVTDAADLYGTAFDLVYDADYLKVVDTTPLLEKTTPKVTEGELINEAGSAQSILLAELEDGDNGRLVVGLTRKGNVQGIDADSNGALLASAHFEAVQLSSGPISITFSTPGLKDSSGADIQVNSWQTANLTVLDLIIQKLDVNDDENIDLQDLILAVQVQTQKPVSGKIYTEAEISGDRKISMPEALAILQVLGNLRTAP